jgi:hypothetical protein
MLIRSTVRARFGPHELVIGAAEDYLTGDLGWRAEPWRMRARGLKEFVWIRTADREASRPDRSP